MSPIVITIAETGHRRVAFSVQAEEDAPSRALAKRMFDLVEPVLRREFQPVQTLYKPVRKQRRSRAEVSA